jgi:hypothetical protein
MLACASCEDRYLMFCPDLYPLLALVCRRLWKETCLRYLLEKEQWQS